VQRGNRICFVAFGAGFTSGAVTLEWTADPACGRRAASIRPEDVHLRMPAEWAVPDQLPPELAAVIARSGRPAVDLSDVVPAEPARHAHGNGRSPRVEEEVRS